MIKEKIHSFEEELAKINEEKLSLTFSKFKKKGLDSENVSPSFPNQTEEIKSLISKNQELNQTIFKLMSDNEINETKLKEKDKKILNLQTTLSEFSQKNGRDSNKTTSNLRNTSQESQILIDQLSKKTNEQNEIIAALKQERNDFKKQNFILVDEYKKLQQEFQILNDRQEILQAELISMKEKIKTLELELIDSKNDEKIKKNQLNKNLLEENAFLNEKIQKLLEEKQSILKENENIYNLLQNMHSGQEKVKEMKETIHQHQNNENILLLKQKEHSETIKKKDELIRKYEENYKKIKNELDERTKQQEVNESLIKQLTRLKDNFSRDQEKVRNLESELMQYKEKDNVQSEKTEFEKEEYMRIIQEYKEKIASLKQDLENSSKGQKEASGYSPQEKTNFLQEINTKDQIIKDLENQIQLIKGEFEKKLREFENEPQDLKFKKLSKRESRELLFKESFDRERNELEQAIFQLKSEISERDKTIRQLTDSFKLMTRDRDNFKNLYNSTMEKLKILEEQFILNKIKLGKALNAAFESGATEIVDIIENAILDADRLSFQSNH